MNTARAMILTDLGIDLLTQIMSMVEQMRKNEVFDLLARVQAVWRGAIQRLQDSSLYVASSYKHIQYVNRKVALGHWMQQPSEAVTSRVRVSRQVMENFLQREGVRIGPRSQQPGFLLRRSRSTTVTDTRPPPVVASRPLFPN